MRGHRTVLLLLLAAPSFGQGPLGMQIFAPADLSTFGGEHEPNEGYFFQFDGLYWSISVRNVHADRSSGHATGHYGIHPITVPIRSATSQVQIEHDSTPAGSRQVQCRQPDRVRPHRRPQRLVREHLPASRPEAGHRLSRGDVVFTRTRTRIAGRQREQQLARPRRRSRRRSFGTCR